MVIFFKRKLSLIKLNIKYKIKLYKLLKKDIKLLKHEKIKLK